MKQWIKEIVILVLAIVATYFAAMTFKYSYIEKLENDNARLNNILNSTRYALIRDTKNAKNQNLVNYFNALGVGWNLPDVATRPDTTGAKN